MTAQPSRILHLALAAAVLLLPTARAEAKTYSAERFDVRVETLPGGTLDVTETVVFRFEDGTFTYVFREIPRRNVDSIEVIRAAMDGRDLPFGDGPGEVELRRRSRVRVRWNFARPIAAASGQPAAHTFTLVYRVHGAIRVGASGDVLAWRALPSQHDYRIDSARIEIVSPAPLDALTEIRRSRVGQLETADEGVERAAGTLVITARDIRKNGWIEPWLAFDHGSLIAEAPAWQQAQRRADALAPAWMLGAGAILVGGVLLFWFLWLRSDRAPRIDVPAGAVPARPEDLPPALAGALASNGNVSHHHAMAALFALADRGALVIEEKPRSRWGSRDFTLRRRREIPPDTPAHERVALDLALTDKKRGRSDEALLSKAAQRIASGMKTFGASVQDELNAMGLIDRGRKAARKEVLAIAIVMLIIGSILFVIAAFLTREFRAWPLLIPTAFIVAGLIGTLFRGAMTPLSDAGVARAAHWRAYQQHLKEVARSRSHLAEAAASVLPFAVALGLGSAWAKFVKKHPVGVPPWFSAVSQSADGFSAFVAYAGASGGGAGAAGAGAAAGGGASGAG